MPIKLYGHSFSTCTQRVMLAAAECNVPFELVVVDVLAGEQKTPEYLAIHPFGMVPYLEDTDTGLVTYESRAIARYIVRKAKSTLMPQPDDPDYLVKMARFDTAASVEHANFDPSAAELSMEKFGKKMRGLGEPDAAKIAELESTLSTKLDGYERILSKQPYLAGEDYSLADLFHIPYGKWLFTIGNGDLITSRPAVSAWWDRLTEREATKKVYAEAK